MKLASSSCLERQEIGNPLAFGLPTTVHNSSTGVTACLCTACLCTACVLLTKSVKNMKQDGMLVVFRWLSYPRRPICCVKITKHSVKNLSKFVENRDLGWFRGLLGKLLEASELQDCPKFKNLGSLVAFWPQKGSLWGSIFLYNCKYFSMFLGLCFSRTVLKTSGFHF